MEQAAAAMLALPLRPEIRNVARYYQAYCLARKGEAGRAAEVLDRVVDRVDAEFRPRATLALAKVYYDSGRLGSSVPIYIEAARAGARSDPLTQVQALRMLAIIRSIDGDHSGALADLERILPSVRRLGVYYPADYHEHLNSLAMELGEAGRIEEANRAIDIALDGPLASRNPHWLDTKLELATKPRRVFTPFAMALGSPAGGTPSSDPCLGEPVKGTLLDPSIAAAAGTEPAAGTNRPLAIRPGVDHSQVSVFLLATQQISVANNSTAVRGERFLSTGRRRPRSLCGYAISPPSRAPPVSANPRTTQHSLD